MGDFLKFSYRELFKKHVKKLIFSGFWSKQPKKNSKNWVLLYKSRKSPAFYSLFLEKNLYFLLDIAKIGER